MSEINNNNGGQTMTMTKAQVEARLTELKKLIADYDKLHNEGGEGYNPYQAESDGLVDKWLTM